jgi:hypothetical protein
VSESSRSRSSAVSRYIDLYREHCGALPTLNNQECEAIWQLVQWALSETRPIAEVSIPLTEAINEPCKGCGKRPIDFISGAQGNDPAAGRWGVTGVRWNGCTHPWVGDPKVMPKKWTCYCGTVVYRSREDAVDD